MKSINKLFLIMCFALFALISCVSSKSIITEVQPSPQVEKTPEVTTVPEMPGEKTEKKVEKEENPRIKFGKDLKTALENGDYEKALLLFENIDKSLENDSKINVLKLSILISANKIQEAEIYANQLEKKYPDSTEVLYSRAILAQAEKNFNKKQVYLKKIIAKDPNNGRALTELGLDLYNKKNYNDARKYFIKAYKADKDRRALLGLSRINYMQNNLEQAEANLNEVLKYEPQNTIALAELARVKSETNRMAEALKNIKMAVELDPQNISHWMDIGDYNRQIGRKEEARVAYTNAINLDDEHYIAYIYRAGLNDDLGYKDEALKDYIKVCNLYPAYYFALEGAGILFWEKEDWQNAKLAFVKALKRSPKSYQYAILVALCEYKMNNKFDAKNFMQQYLKTIDRTKNKDEYFICRLFVDFVGDIDILNMANREKDINKKGRIFFYLAEFYNLTNKPKLATKCYEEVLAIEVPAFFEYRLAEKGLDTAPSSDL